MKCIKYFTEDSFSPFSLNSFHFGKTKENKLIFKKISEYLAQKREDLGEHGGSILVLIGVLCDPLCQMWHRVLSGTTLALFGLRRPNQNQCIEVIKKQVQVRCPGEKKKLLTLGISKRRMGCPSR